MNLMRSIIVLITALLIILFFGFNTETKTTYSVMMATDTYTLSLFGKAIYTGSDFPLNDPIPKIGLYKYYGITAIFLMGLTLFIAKRTRLAVIGMLFLCAGVFATFIDSCFYSIRI